MRIATALLLITSFAPAARADEPPDAIRGKAFIAGGDRLAARVTLHFFGRDAPMTTVVTDAGGRFRCPIPPGLALGAVKDGQAGPSCWMEIQEAGRWTWEPIDAGSPSHRGMTKTQQMLWLRQTAAEAIMRQVRATWRPRAGVMNLEVECAPTGEVEVIVRGAGGAPMADRTVRVIPAWALAEIHMPVTIQYEGRTDGAGRFRMRWSEGMQRLRVIAPGEGFGATGAFEVRAGQLAHQEMPPLARLGSIAGRLDPKLAGPSTAVVLEAQGPYLAEAACDPEGRFTLRDVRPGSYRVKLLRNGRPAGAFAAVRVVPGRQVAGIVIGPAPAEPGRPPLIAPAGPRGQPGGGTEEVTLLEGTVRDEQGRGVSGADVYVHSTYFGGMRMGERVEAATTDGRGRYQVRGPRLQVQMRDDSTVIAHAAGRPPALAYAPPPGDDGRPAALDLTLPDADRGGSARVTVFHYGKPMAGASVRLERGSPVIPPRRVQGRGAARGPAPDAMYAVLYPAAVTDADGVARFTGLLPGQYGLMATAGGDAAATARGLGVAAGRDAAFAIAIHPQPCIARFQVLRPDGTPVVDQSVSITFRQENAGWSTSMRVDGQGIGSGDFRSPGLWAVDVRFCDTPLRSFPVISEPFYQAVAFVPISPVLPADQPIRLKAVHRGLGSLKVRLVDADGRPARGTVETLALFNQPDLAASTDERGVVVFRDLPSGSYPFHGFIDGPAAPVPDSTGSSPPLEDSALGGHAMIPSTTATVESGRESTVELRARPVGYVRGIIRPPAGHKAAEFIVSPAIDYSVPETRWRIDRESGRFLAGPLLPGKNEHRFQRQAEDGSWQEAGVQAVEVPAGAVAHVELRPEEPRPPSAPGTGQPVTPGWELVRELRRNPAALISTVVLDDGKTPAFAAQAMLYVPQYSQPIGAGLGDVSGRLAWHGLSVSIGSRDDERPKHVERPTVVVRIPGRTGAVVTAVEPGRPVRVVLPAPRGVEGRVTLGGRPVDGRNARIRVLAAHRGRGDVLDEALSVEATAQADGRFDLRGLTPGRYAVQAARDGIWLSRTIELTISADKDPPPLALDIPEPGAPVTLQVVDREGRPVPDYRIGLVRPEGPLASLWPSGLRTGPDGTLTLRGLEAGRHAILIGEGKERRDVVVRAADDSETRPAVERIVVPRAGP